MRLRQPVKSLGQSSHAKNRKRKEDRKWERENRPDGDVSPSTLTLAGTTWGGELGIEVGQWADGETKERKHTDDIQGPAVILLVGNIAKIVDMYKKII